MDYQYMEFLDVIGIACRDPQDIIGTHRRDVISRALTGQQHGIHSQLFTFGQRR
jgi:hypothetical protein